MRSFVLLAVLAGAAMAAPKPDVKCITKGNTVIEVYDVTVTDVVYVTEGAVKPTPTYVPAHTTKRRKHKHKPKPTTTAAAVYTQPPPPPQDVIVTVTLGAGGYEQAPPPSNYVAPPPSYEAPPPPPPPVETHAAPPPQHTEVVSNAPSNSGSKPSSGSSPADFVDIHNWYRSKFGCSGVQWSDELASYAASKTPVCQMVHTGGPYGENLAMGTSLDGVSSVNMWMSEASAYDYNNPTFSMQAGHFSQVVWKGTERIGCSVQNCGDQNYVMCEYEPAGNMMGAFAEEVPRLLAGASLD